MDVSTPFRQQEKQHTTNNNDVSHSSPTQSKFINGGNLARDNFSSNARRLQLRNAGFRATLLPARRLSPPQSSIGALAVAKVENNENDCIKTKDYPGYESLSPLNILREINNSSQINSTPRKSVGDTLGFADDEKDESAQDCSDTMIFKTEPVRSIKNRKKGKREPSFQSNKYIEYLENELGAVTERLGSLQSPETVRGQAAKIRKLERKIQEFSKQISDWEQNYEERVNDEVFERVHGESDLRLKIFTLEEAASHKEAHVAELGKELEDAKTKLIESESVEVILGRRVDALTELLARSPKRTSFSISDTPVAPRCVKSRAPRFSMSPTRDLQSIENVDTLYQANELMWGSPLGMPRHQKTEHVVETDTESIELDTFSGPFSEILSTRSSQTSPSRPTSVFSTYSCGISSTGDRKSVGHPRRSRRFAPGTTGLKPLILPTTAGLHNQNGCYTTPEKRRSAIHIDDNSSWRSVGDLSFSTPNQPQNRRPYSWAHHPTEITPQNISEDDESEDETFMVNNDQIGGLPAFLKCGTPESVSAAMKITESIDGSSPVQPKLSLRQELEAEDSFIESSHDSNLSEECPFQMDESAESTFSALEKLQPPRMSMQKTNERKFISDLKSSRDVLPPELRNSYLASIVASLRQKPLDLARQILVRSWTRGMSQFRGFGWWILKLFFRSCKVSDVTDQAHTPKKQGTVRNDVTSPSSHSENAVEGRAAISSHNRQLPRRNFGLAKLLPHLQTLIFPDPNVRISNRCPQCVEPSGRRQLKLWTKLALALILAVGYAIIEGPGAVLQTDDDYNEQGLKLPQTVRDDEEKLLDTPESE